MGEYAEGNLRMSDYFSSERTEVHYYVELADAMSSTLQENNPDVAFTHEPN